MTAKKKVKAGLVEKASPVSHVLSCAPVTQQGSSAVTVFVPAQNTLSLVRMREKSHKQRLAGFHPAKLLQNYKKRVEESLSTYYTFKFKIYTIFV